MKDPLSITHPQIAAQWHPTKNGDLTPDKMLAGSNKRAWWKCPQGSDHEWEAVIANRARLGAGCPCCAGRNPSVTNSLASLYPELAKQWHPAKNSTLTPDQIVAGSHKKVWWKCFYGSDHEWEASVSHRVKGTGCPFCAGQKASLTNSLSSLYPELAKQWNSTKNGRLTPDQVVAGSETKVWWVCSNPLLHEWKASIVNRVKGSGCPFCSGRAVSDTNSLASLYPEIAKQWHPTKNEKLTPDQVVAGSGYKVWWQCLNDKNHEWKAVIDNRVRGTGCPFCAGQKVSVTNSLSSLYPELAKQWHPSKNEKLTPDQVVAGSNKKVWWQCPNGTDHQWQAAPNTRAGQRIGCPFCAGKSSSVTNSLTSLYPEIAKQWHPTKNGMLTPDHVVSGSHSKAWWGCSNDPNHEWEAVIKSRVNGSGCPFCSGRRPTVVNSLARLYPEIAKEWHPLKNGTLTPEEVTAKSSKKAWWRCAIDPSHEWEATLANRTTGRGCPACNKGWTIEALRGFIGSLVNHLETFSAADLYTIFQQSGLLQTQGKGKGFVKALATGRFPKEEIEKFVNSERSIVDKFLQDKQLTLEAHETSVNDDISNKDVTSKDNFDDQIDETIEPSEEANDLELPVVQTREVLASLDHSVVSSADEEAVEFLIASAKAKIWKHVFRDEAAALAQAQSYTGDSYAERVKTEFLDEYHRAKNLPIPTGYNFRINGKIAEPNLMQRLAAVQVRDKKRVGNWSGTGAGKTLSAVLASRVINAHLTLICCPNSVVDGWKKAILNIFPDSAIATKTFTPDWANAVGDETGLGAALNLNAHRYIIVNYEKFQQPDSADWVRSFVESELIDFIVIDEIHYTKQRQVENISRRKQLVSALITAASDRNPNLHIIGMSATPVINNLQEGKSLVELVTGVAHDELDIHQTIANCMKLHQRLVTLGIRWMPDYKQQLGEPKDLSIPVDCSEFIDEIRALGRKGTHLALEQILTRARLPVIREQIKPKTLIYTHYVQGIDKLLRDALEDDGWKVGFYTGEVEFDSRREILQEFKEGNIDVLIGSSAIATGVDGLQQACNRLIINVLPWTHAEFEQLIGRIYRQGQQNPVTIVIPLTYAHVNGERWSWCDSKMQRLRFKKSIADAAVDGVVPEGYLRSPAQAYQDIIAWLEKLETGVQVIARPKIVIPIPDNDPADVQRRLQRYGDFSAMNRHWNQTRSETTHHRLQENPEEWSNYHTLYTESRKNWAVIPYEEMIRWCQQRSGYTIGDFGCGQAKLAEAVSDRHTVYSFDHVAVNQEVIACDMAHVPLDDQRLDVAIFCLSLMGANFTDYLREANRTLKLDGQLHIIEATSRFSDRPQFQTDLEALGFIVVSVQDAWKFTHIHALKTERRPQTTGELQF
ncbi:zinc-ribbon domain-containing protein [Coleofasciculus sp. FACHB-T130]|uniref:zinc-ribbon domain-containing protein n=1 Tax=Cyanophyceae TaxID=3028117 RepID=UPI00168327B5|nr:zinc-ribbon domain-containing protein [Coleofasciculus sp. FACHB-T130]MBD1881195.1 DEAD/DEAH box helicase family protein [Coleofasciculus sp. FACHB-T130]